MVMSKHRGQTVTELVIILALISVAGIAALFLLGGNINEMFTRAYDNFKDFDPLNAKATVATVPDSDDDVTPFDPPLPDLPPADSVNTLEIEGIEVTQYADGSYSFPVGAQNITISPEQLSKMNTVLETTGSAGLSDLVKEMAYLVDKVKDDYGGADVPIDIQFGTSARICQTASDDPGYEGIAFPGTAEVNSVTIAAGNQLILLTNDQAQGAENPLSGTLGKYRIEGYIDNSGQDMVIENGSYFKPGTDQKYALDIAQTRHVEPTGESGYKIVIDNMDVYKNYSEAQLQEIWGYQNLGSTNWIWDIEFPASR
jgi:Flp pilus assembly pilin Flp